MAEDIESTGDPAPPDKASSRRRKFIIWGAILVVIVVITPFAWVYLGSPEFCNTCHEMKPIVQGWREAQHAEEGWATCLDCHADPGFFGELNAHIGGALYVYKHFLERPEPTDLVAEVKPEWCVNCHEEAWEEGFAEEHPTQDSPCAVCHRDTSHANENPVYPESMAEEGEDS